ncbi:hypothetical protein ColLi_13260 [Colletotrichum liriopes]|uniref:Uncharacterized protein n=1 Tax=Colletotrichum liriopes TaxID=708192 RepID=A0AA37H1Y4_9PEZI|nr:hypothetical protein ColLi_13260 [Colletotrichum liriopes]
MNTAKPSPGCLGPVVVEVCVALHSLHLLRPDDPFQAPTPFDYLQLHAASTPFSPPSLAHLGPAFEAKLR